MTRFGVSSRFLSWRRLTAWMAIYALVLQGILVGLLAAHASAGSGAPAGYEICLHDADDGAGAPSGLPGSADDKSHCPLCVAATQQVVAPARTPPLSFRFAELGEAFRPASDGPVASSFQYADHRSRAPPAAA